MQQPGVINNFKKKYPHVKYTWIESNRWQAQTIQLTISQIVLNLNFLTNKSMGLRILKYTIEMVSYGGQAQYCNYQAFIREFFLFIFFWGGINLAQNRLNFSSSIWILSSKPLSLLAAQWQLVLKFTCSNYFPK